MFERLKKLFGGGAKQPDEESVWLGLGDLYWETGNRDEAARQYGRVLQAGRSRSWA